MSDHDDPKYQPGEPLAPGDAPPGAIISPDTHRKNRIPPGQARTRKWPVLHYGSVPQITLEDWRLEVGGLVETPLSFTWEEFRALPRVQVFSDFHCVTRWSRLGNVWEGVSTREILGRAGVKPEARFALPLGYDNGWTTNLPLEYFTAEDALFADTHDGEPISADHGGPVRLIIPQLYAWKSAKWVKAVELVAEDRPGLWEQGGYHDRGDPWVQNDLHDDGERFRMG
ncbi:MAG: sulfite oxidase-like oxidoreductase [Planctomycetota bacterium]|nr:MAG: sulfite oxidase-like oxidoreductase [Planctomycetota bacterium]REK26099.1 MAG: sulfite oxidase-like oxidoreductase [Planctomycetota bacterium]REK27087.1 MAG: sulfite oxidase-like oxidoreductase [Planctomycetota bacterium]